MTVLEVKQMNHDKEEGTRSLIIAGSEIAGGAAGAAIGFFWGGPEGAAVGAASAHLFKRAIISIGDDISERFLSEREKMRIGGTISYATKRFEERLAVGDKLREDGFLKQPSTSHAACAEIPIIERPAAQEVLEGVLLVAQREHEEKKIPFLGNLLANFAFDSTIDKAQANLLIKIGEDLSFRQMCLLNLFYEDNTPTGRPNTDDQNVMSLSQELLALFSQELLFNTRGGPTTKESTFLQPSAYILHGVGRMLHSLMELKGIDEADMGPIRCMLAVRRLPSRSPRDRVLWLLENSGNRMAQSDLRRNMGMQYADLDSILEELEKEGRIKIDTNMISSK